eukprot:3851677-Prymnesium_polylepis.1
MASCWQPRSDSSSAAARSHSCSGASASCSSCTSTAGGRPSPMALSAMSTPRRTATSGWKRKPHAKSCSARPIGRPHG